MRKNLGFSLVELMMGMLVFFVVAGGILYSIMSFNKQSVVSTQHQQMRALMKLVEDDLVNKSKGPPWFAMTKTDVNKSGSDYDSSYSKLAYDLTVGDITNGVRQCTIVVRSTLPGAPKQITSNLTLSPRRGRANGGVIEVIAQRTSDSGPAQDIYCQAIPFEGTAVIPGKTDSSGQVSFSGTQIGPTTIVCNTAYYAACPYFFNSTLDPNDPNENPHGPTQVRIFNVTTALGEKSTVSFSVSKKAALTVRVFKRDLVGGVGTDTSNPVGKANIYIEARNTIVPLPNGYLGSTYETESNGTWTKYVVPGDYRITMFGTKPLPATEQRAGYDQPSTAMNTVGYFPLAENQNVTKDYWLIKMGNASGTAHIVNYNNPTTNQFDTSGVTANDLPVRFRQDKNIVRLYYSNVAGPLSYPMNNSVMYRIGLGRTTPIQNVRTNSSNGTYTLYHIAPVIVHATAAVISSTYAPENARSFVLPWIKPSTTLSPIPAGLTPILVWANGGFPKDRNNVQFFISRDDGKQEVYPSNTPYTNFLFLVRSDGLHVDNTGKDLYMLGNDPSNFARFSGNIFQPGPTPYTCPAGWICSISPYIIDTTAHRWPGLQVQGTVVAYKSKLPVTSDTYDFPNLIPPLGTDKMYMVYKAQGNKTEPGANYIINTTVNYNYYDPINNEIVNANRTNHPDDDFSADMDVYYYAVNGNKTLLFSETGAPFTDGVLPTLSRSYALLDSHRVESAHVQPVPGVNTPTPIPVPASPDSTAAKHRLFLPTNPTDYEPIGEIVSGDPRYFRLFYSPGAPPSFTGTLLLRLNTLVTLSGHVANVADTSLAGIKVTIKIDTHSDDVSFTDASGNYNRSVRVPQTDSPWQWYIHLDDLNGDYLSQDSQAYRMVNDPPTPSAVARDFVMQYKPGKGL